MWNNTEAQYISFNFNVMDASAAPGVTATEPGEMESREMMRITEMIAKFKNASVIDVSELCPMFDVSGTAARLAVCVITRIMAALAKERGEVIDSRIRRSDLLTE